MDAAPRDLLTAALGYADRGWRVFPVPFGTKKSHKSGERSNGRSWGATRDPMEIERDFKEWPEAGVGVPTRWSTASSWSRSTLPKATTWMVCARV